MNTIGNLFVIKGAIHVLTSTVRRGYIRQYRPNREYSKLQSVARVWSATRFQLIRYDKHLLNSLKIVLLYNPHKSAITLYGLSSMNKFFRILIKTTPEMK